MNTNLLHKNPIQYKMFPITRNQMATYLEQLGSELSLIRANGFQCDWNTTLNFCRTELISSGQSHYEPTKTDDLLHDVLLKNLLRGHRPFSSYFAEQWIIALYGGVFSIEELSKQNRSSAGYSFNDELPALYKNYSDVIDPWPGSTPEVAFDPEHPENEREFFSQLVSRFGSQIAHCIEPQADISSILDTKEAASFTSQRADFLLSFPNGSRLILEPGDHDDTTQINLDRRRDAAFQKIGVDTVRFRNSEIVDSDLYDKIGLSLVKLGTSRFLHGKNNERSEKDLAANYLFLLPSLITRLERLLVHFLLRQGLIHRPKLNIGVIERDLECAEISLASFFERLSRLLKLYGIDYKIPSIQLYVQRNPAYRYGNIDKLKLPAKICSSFAGLTLDLILDVGIKCNSLTKSALLGAENAGSTRQTFSHNRPVRFSYCAQVQPIQLSSDTEEVLNSFVRDFFRKYALRPGQGPILKNILSQKSTIGLLPTSAGKSLCYQLAALLTPGSTIVVDPIVALMKDQAQSLVEQYGIDRVFAWHAGSGFHDKNVSALLCENIIVFLSPERLLRPQFRAAMRAINAADVFINYAVIDEAHCVSMWGHDFRPSYLTLERNFREYCTFQGKSPVLVALTGTASQLVLIDLKRELNIQDVEAIIRPDTFDRPELHFNLVTCPGKEKVDILRQVMAAIARRLNVQHLHSDAHGIIFAYYPNELWELFGEFVGNAGDCVRTMLTAPTGNKLRYGIYTGSSPSENKKSLFKTEEWNQYKDKTLSAFKRGDIQMLFGNTAVSVGIDNEQLNYVINYRMPQSLEAYYQQCGRAGRSGQTSECYLIFSDDSPNDTQKWLNSEVLQHSKRWDDLGIVTRFHQGSFPGYKTDSEGALKVFRKLFAESDQQGLAEIPAYLDDLSMTKDAADRTERYLSWWLILGVLVDYEVTGMDKNTVFHVRRHHVVDQFIRDRDEAPLKVHIIAGLHKYLSRYRPTVLSDVEKALDSREEPFLSGRAIGYLINFIYSQVEYQRREAIRTMVSFCNQVDTSPDRLRATIKGYFDRSEKFSDGLLAMANAVPDFATVASLLDRVEGFDDVEHLYWETRRLLDERFRPDWAAANLFAIIYREKAAASDTFMRLLDDTVSSLAEDSHLGVTSTNRFLANMLSYFARLDTVFGESISSPFLAQCFGRLYEKHGLTYISLIEEMNVPDSHREFMQLYVINLQLKEIANANYSRIIG